MTAVATPTPAYLQRPTTVDKRLAPPRAYGRYAMALRLRDTIVRLVRDAAGNARPRLVDLGCGDMPYRSLVVDVLASYHGVDLPGNQHATYHLGADGRSTAPDGCADLVLSTQVLEHVRDVPGYLAEACRLLAPGGQIILSTHGTWTYHADPQDYWRWTHVGLKTVLADAGLEATHHEGLLGLVPLGIQLAQDGVVRKLPKRLRNPACFFFQQAVLLADKIHTDADRAKDACVYAFVARKHK